MNDNPDNEPVVGKRIIKRLERNGVAQSWKKTIVFTVIFWKSLKILQIFFGIKIIVFLTLVLPQMATTFLKALRLDLLLGG